MESSDETPWMSRAEAMKKLGVSKNTMLAWEQSGVLTPHRVGDRGWVKYLRTEVDAVYASTQS